MSGKAKLKEKILAWYDRLFSDDHVHLVQQPNFWPEFFLLRPKCRQLTEGVKEAHKDSIQVLVAQCLIYIESGTAIQCAAALQTLQTVIAAMSARFKPEHVVEILDFLFVFDRADAQLGKLAELIIATMDAYRECTLIKELTMSLLVSCVTARDTIEQNPLFSRLLTSPMPSDLIKLFADSGTMSDILGNRLVGAFSLFLSLRTNNNPSLQSLSCLDSALALDGIGTIIERELKLLIDACLAEYKERERLREENAAWFSSYVSGLFTADPAVYEVACGDAPLLALFYTLKMNRNFIPLLTQWRARESEIESESDEVATSGSPPLATFLEYVSLLQQDMKDEKKRTSTILAFSILSLITEDQYANTFLHDSSVKFRLRLHRAPLRHRPVKSNDLNSIPSTTFAAWILELCSEFIVSHLMKTFPMELHILSIGIIHRLLIYQKRSKCRLNYNWRSLWETIIHLLRFITSNETSLLRQFSHAKVNQLIISALIIINIFITFGDIILQTTHKYDELYYELIRLKSVFLHVEAYTNKTDKNQSDPDGCRQLHALLYNIMSIIEHYSTIITENNGLNESEILSLIQSSYDGLKLHILDGLDNFEKVQSRYLNDIIYDIVKSIVLQYRAELLLAPLDYKRLTK